MKAAVFALALFASCVLSVRAATGRQLLQAVAPAPSNNCPTTVFDAAEAAGLTSFLEAAELDDLQSSLDNSTGYPLRYTVFAPTNEAFDSALAGLGRTDLEDVLNHGQLDAILQYHFLTTPYPEAQLLDLGTVVTNYQNQTLEIIPDGTIVGFGSNATITQGNNQACESVIHIIDNVLLPDFSSIYAPAGAPEASSS